MYCKVNISRKAVYEAQLSELSDALDIDGLERKAYHTYNEVSKFKGYTAVSVPMFVAGHFLTDPALDLDQRMAYVLIPLGLPMLAYGG